MQMNPETVKYFFGKDWKRYYAFTDFVRELDLAGLSWQISRFWPNAPNRYAPGNFTIRFLEQTNEDIEYPVKLFRNLDFCKNSFPILYGMIANSEFLDVFLPRDKPKAVPIGSDRLQKVADRTELERRIMDAYGLSPSDMEAFETLISNLVACGLDVYIPQFWSGLDCVSHHPGPRFKPWLFEKMLEDGSFLVKLKKRLAFVSSRFPVLWSYFETPSEISWMFDHVCALKTNAGNLDSPLSEPRPSNPEPVVPNPVAPEPPMVQPVGLPEIKGEDVESEDASRECCVCTVNINKIVLIPCGHVPYCFECYDRSRADLKGCPECRQSVQSAARVYV